MKTIALSSFDGDWPAIVRDVQGTGEVVALEFGGALCGLLLPTHDAERIAQYFARPVLNVLPQTVPPAETRNYLELLRDDPTLVPVVDAQPLEFVTMMNSSYIDPQQIYQFRHPATRQIYVYSASELQLAIGRVFARVEFIPQHPKDFVDAKPEQGTAVA